MITRVRIGGATIGPGERTYVIAELSGNHNKSLDRARQLIEAAKEAGADAVKLQTYTPDTITMRSDAAPFRIASGGLWSGRTLHDLYEEAYMPWEWQPELMQHARTLGIDLFSSPFDETAVEFLERMDVPAYKVASFEIVDVNLVARMARTGRPLIISTGMATIAEIQAAIDATRHQGNDQIVLLKCTSGYPAEPSEMNLKTIPHMSSAFGVPVGLSDHSRGIGAAIAAVALGACVVEKHFTLDRADGGPDAEFSCEPQELRDMVDAIRVTERAIGEVHYGPTPDEKRLAPYRRSLFVVSDVAEGQLFTSENIRSIRPGGGLEPARLVDVLGRRARRRIRGGTPLTWDLVQ